MSRVSVFGSGGGWRLEVGGCGGCGGWRLEAGGCRLAGWQSTLSSPPLFRDVPLHSRRPGPSRSLLLVVPPSPPLLGVCPVSPSRAALPCCLATEHGNGLRRPRLPSGRTLMLGRESRREPRLASLPLATPRLVSPRFVSRARDLGARASRISL